MYSIICTHVHAHSGDAVWCCAWARVTKKKNPEDTGKSDNESSVSQLSDSDESNTEYSDIIVTGGVDDLVKVWEFRGNKLYLKHSLRGHSMGVMSVAITSDGLTCVSSATDCTLRIWNIESGICKAFVSVGRYPAELWTVAIGALDQYVVTGSQHGQVTFYNIDSGTSVKVIDTGLKFVISVAYSRNGRYIACGATDGLIRVFKCVFPSGELLYTIQGHSMPVRSLCFSNDTQMLLTASDDCTMKLYKVRNGLLIATLYGHLSWVLSAAFSLDGKRVVSGSSDKSVKVWDVANKQCIHTFTEHVEQICGVAFSPDNMKVMSVSEDGGIIIYDCEAE